jgi:hypothetical protein
VMSGGEGLYIVVTSSARVDCRTPMFDPGF